MGRHRQRRAKWYTGPSLRECMSEALQPVWQEEVVQPVRRVRERVTTRTDFGDAQLQSKRAFGRMFLRMVVVSPVGAVGVVLCVSVIGLPLGFPLLMWVGAWCSKPVRKHPNFNPDAGVNMSRVDELELYYEQHGDDNN